MQYIANCLTADIWLPMKEHLACYVHVTASHLTSVTTIYLFQFVTRLHGKLFCGGIVTFNYAFSTLFCGMLAVAIFYRLTLLLRGFLQQ